MKIPSMLMQIVSSPAAMLGLAFAMPASTQAAAADSKPTIVLVHGAFADGSSWSKVILQLERAGYPTLTVQNPLSSLSADIATTKRAVESVKGPVILVGHSYGGAVISGAGTGSPNVKALVYIAAFAPDAGEILGELNGRFGPAPLGSALIPDSAGFLSVDRSKFRAVFAADVPPDEVLVLAAAQKPLNSAAFGSSIESAAWKTIPSWYLVSTEDSAIPVELQRFMARRIGAKSIVEVKSSHVSYISHPAEVVKLIEAAAQSPK